MNTFDVVLFAHIVLVVAGLMMAGVMHTGLTRVRVADEVSELRVWARIFHRLETFLPLAAVAVFATGLWLVLISDEEFHLSDGWVVVSIGGLVLAELIGGALRPKSIALRSAVAAAPDGPVPPELRARVTDPVLIYAPHVATALFFGVIYLMVLKPSTIASILVLVVALVVGLASAVPFASRPTALAR